MSRLSRLLTAATVAGDEPDNAANSMHASTAAIATAGGKVEERLRFFRFRDVVPELYGSALMVSPKLLHEQPQVARGLVRPGVVRLKLLAPDDLRWDIAFIWRDGAYLSRAAQAWLELLRERPVTASVF